MSEERERLLELAAKVEALEGADREVDGLIGLVTGPACMQPDGSWMIYREDGYTHSMHPPAYTVSLDAAMTLVEDGANWSVEAGPGYATAWCDASGDPAEHHSVFAVTPSLALTAAALRARAAR